MLVNYSSDLGAINTSWPWRNSAPVFLDDVDCQSNETTLLNCSHFNCNESRFNCCSGGYPAAVECSEKRLRVQNVSVATVNTTAPTIVISWELYSGAPYKPSSFRVKFFNRHKEYSWVNNGTLTHYQISVGDLLSSTFFACCVSAIYYQYYETESRCTSTDSLSDLFTTSAPNLTITLNKSFTAPTSTHVNSSMMSASKNIVVSDINMQASITGGVFGSIIIILLLLLAVCGGLLLFLLIIGS